MPRKASLDDNEPYLYEGIWIRGPEEIYIIKDQKSYNNISIIPGDVVMDIGGHCGYSARYFLKRGASKVYSYEPMPANFEILSLNSENYEIYPTRAAIVGTDQETLELFSPNSKYTSGHSYIYKKGRTPTTVPALNFLKEILDKKPTVLKLDIEGVELTLFDGWKNLPDYVRSIGMEVHYYAPDAREKAKELQDLLSINYNVVQPMKYLEGGWDRCIAAFEHK